MTTGPKSEMLKKIRVLDFTRVLSGPFCTRMFSDLGAEVIKVESDRGDSMRMLPPFRGGFASYFTQFNVGKKSIGVNLRHPQGLELVKKLVPHCDVVIENFRPGVMAKMGLGYPVLKEINPRIIFCSISGFGQTGPEAKRLAYTDMVQAYSGMDYMAGKMIGPDADPPGFPYSFGDSYASLNATVAILAALLHREFTGEGQAIDISMLDCLLAANDSTLQKFIFSDGKMDTAGVAFRPPLRMKNGQMAVALFMNFERVLQGIGRPELLQDERFKTLEARGNPANFDQYLRIVREWAQKVTVEEATRIFDQYDIPYGKVNSIAEIVQSPVVRHRNMLVAIELKENEKALVVNTPFRFSNSPCEPQDRPPHLGEHNREVFGGLLKFSETEMERLGREGVLVQQKAS